MYGERIRIPIGTDAGRKEITLAGTAACLWFSGMCGRAVDVYDGYGESTPLVRLAAWEQRMVILPRPATSLTVTWGAGFGQTVLDFFATAGTAVSTGQHGAGVTLDRAENDPTRWGAATHPRPDLSAAGLVAPILRDPITGAAVLWDGRPPARNTYSVVPRRGFRTYVHSVAFSAPGRIQVCTLWNASPGIGYLRLVRADIAIVETSAAAEVWVDLVRISTQPAGGSGVTPVGHASVTPASFTEVRRAPATPGIEASEPISSCLWRLGITGADSTAHPAAPVNWQTLYAPTDPAELRPYVPAGAGLAIVADASAPATVDFAYRLTWIED